MTPIRLQSRVAGGQSARDLHILRNQTAEEGGQGMDHFIEFENLRSARFMPGENEKLAGERRATHTGLLNLLDEGPVRIGLGHAGEDESAVGHDDSEDIVEVVRHAPGQAPEQFHFLRLEKLLLQEAFFVAVGRFRERAANGRHEAREARLQNVVRCAASHRVDGRIFADHAADDDQGDARANALRHGQGLQSVELRQLVVGENEVEAALRDFLPETRARIHDVDGRVDVPASQHRGHQRGILTIVLQMQNAHGRFHGAAARLVRGRVK